MRTTIRPLQTIAVMVAVTMSLGTAGCSRSGVPSATAAPSASSDFARPQTACWLIPAAAASKVMNEALTPVAELAASEYGNTSCHYYADGQHNGHRYWRLTVTLDWNGYNVIAMRIPDHGPATAKAPYADIGDGARLASGILWVRLGHHSLAIEARKGADIREVATGIVAAARATLGK